MPSLGFSVEHKAPSLRRAPANFHPRRGNVAPRSDRGFVLGMVSLGLTILAAAAWHGQALATLHRLLSP